MNTTKKTNAISESVIMTAIAIALIFASMYIPVFSFIIMLLPVPFILLGVKHGLRYNIISMGIAMAFVGFFLDVLMALIIFTISGFSSVALTYMIRRKYSFSKTIFLSSVLSLIALLLVFTIIFSLSGIDISEKLRETIELGNELNEEFFNRFGLNMNESQQASEVRDLAIEKSLMLIPSFILFGFVINTFINYAVASSILKRMNYHIAKPAKFSYFKLPRNIFMGTIIIMISTYIMKLMKFIKFEALVLNVIVIFSMVYLIQGLAVVSFFIEKRGIKKTLRRTILIFLFFIPILSNFLPYIGLFDVILNIRKLEG